MSSNGTYRVPGAKWTDGYNGSELERRAGAVSSRREQRITGDPLVLNTLHPSTVSSSSIPPNSVVATQITKKFATTSYWDYSLSCIRKIVPEVTPWVLIRGFTERVY